MNGLNGGRAAALEALRTQAFDVLVVGGGVVGTGVARDLALRGVRVALVEQHDLASGTSSRPTRLVHGGLRYLEIFDFGLVREDLREREILLRVAPHLVFPLPFLLPQYGRSMAYRAKLLAGMQLYDLLSFDKSLPSRKWLSREETLAAEPALNGDGLQGAWRYYDAQLPLVERLVVESALDAAAHGATVLTHARVERFLRDDGDGASGASGAGGEAGASGAGGEAGNGGGTVTGAVVRDTLSGEEAAVRAALTVNASGPWLDMTDRELRPARPPLLRLTKGVHLVVPSGTRNALAVFAQSDGRLFFLVPWMGYTLVGTTDTDYRGDPASAAADEEDVRYLQAEARRAFPGAPFETVHYAYAGVRALVRVEGVKEGKVSRKHKVLDHALRDGVGGIVSVVGGKITAYRGIAEEVGDLAIKKLGWGGTGLTERRPFPGGALGASGTLDAFIEGDLWPRARAVGLDRQQAEHLGRTYGALGHEVLDLAERDAALRERLAPDGPGIAAEAVRAVEREWSATLADFLLRRSCIGLRADQALPHVERIAEMMGRVCGWDAARREEEVARYRDEIAPMRRFSTAS